MREGLSIVEYDEEEVCQEIEEQLGVLPVRLGYQPQRAWYLQEYWIKEAATEAIVRYAYAETKRLHVYISKDYDESKH